MCKRVTRRVVSEVLSGFSLSLKGVLDQDSWSKRLKCSVFEFKVYWLSAVFLREESFHLEMLQFSSAPTSLVRAVVF